MFIVLLLVVIAFAAGNVIMTIRGHPRAVSIPFFTAWGAGMLALSLLDVRFGPADHNWAQRAVDEVLASLWVAGILLSAALVTERFQRGSDILNTMFAAVFAAVVGMFVGGIIMALISCTRGLGCI